jgi:PAS domain S-box-containing protein
MSEFAALLENEIRRQKTTAKDMAGLMGIDASVISQFTNDTRASCRPDTLMKMVSGVSKDPAIQAELLQAYFRDQVIDRYKQWIKVELSSRSRESVKEEDGNYGSSPLADHTSAIKTLNLPNDVLRALTDIARAIPGRQKFRIVIEDLGEFAREDLLAEPLAGYSRKTPLVVTDIAGRVTSANPAFTRMCGHPLSKLLGEKPGALLQGPDTEPEIVRDFHRAIAAREPLDRIMTNYDAKRRRYKVHIQMTPIFDLSGQLTGFRAIERRLPAAK